MRIVPAENRIPIIGYETENDRTQVRFDLSDIMSEFPGGNPALVILRPGDEVAYPAVSVSQEGTDFIWTVESYDLLHRGILKAQVIYTVSKTIAKTKIYHFKIDESLTNFGEEPPEWEDWVEELLEAASAVHGAIADAEATLDEKVSAAQDAQTAAEGAQAAAEAAQTAAESARTGAGNAQAAAEAAQTGAENAQAAAEAAQDAAEDARGNAELAQSLAEDAQMAAAESARQAAASLDQYSHMQATAHQLPEGSSPTASIDHSGQYPVLELGMPKGDTGAQGAQGLKGDDGYSPTVSISETPTGHWVTIVDKNGNHAFFIKDGQDGAVEYHICSSNEYDHETRMPTISNPNPKYFYLVPAENPASPDLFVEWIYVSNAWEMFGSATVDVSGKLDILQPAGDATDVYGVDDDDNTCLTAIASVADVQEMMEKYGTSMIVHMFFDISSDAYISEENADEVLDAYTGGMPVMFQFGSLAQRSLRPQMNWYPLISVSKNGNTYTDIIYGQAPMNAIIIIDNKFYAAAGK